MSSELSAQARQLESLRAENARLREENAELEREIASLRQKGETDELRKSYSGLSISIDETTGKVKGFDRAYSGVLEKNRKDRLRESLAQAAELLGPRAVAVCRELTKTHEEFILGRLEKWQELPEELLGEITVIIGPPEQKERADEAEARRALGAVMAAADERLKPKEVARRAQEMAPGWSAKELYELLTRA